MKAATKRNNFGFLLFMVSCAVCSSKMRFVCGYVFTRNQEVKNSISAKSHLAPTELSITNTKKCIIFEIINYYYCYFQYCSKFCMFHNIVW